MTNKKVKKVILKVASKKKKTSSTGVAKRQSRNLAGVNPMGALGGLAGQYFGGPAGGALGMAAGNLISKITGFGAYRVQRNTVSEGNSVASFRNDGDGMTVCHREFLTDILGSVNFNNTAYSINPGLARSFPWLSLIAADFEEYELKGLVYEYRPTSGTAVSATSAALGVVILATDYDVANPLFGNKQQMESYEYSTSTVPFSACMHPVECAKNKNVFNNLYVRTAPAPLGTDLRLYDVGNFQIATQGMQTTFVVGELWATYHYVFRKPRIPTTPVRLGYARLRETPNGTSAAAVPFGTGGPLITSDSSLGISNGTAINTFVMSIPGAYFISSLSQYTGGFFTAYSTTFGANIVGGSNNLRDNTANALQFGNAVSAFGDFRFVSVLQPGTGVANQVTITATASGTPVGNMDMIITYLSSPVPLSASYPPGAFVNSTEGPTSLVQCMKRLRVNVEDEKCDGDVVMVCAN